MIVTATEVDRDAGTVVVFVARREDGADILIAVDHRMAQPIADNLPMDVEVEPYQILGFVQWPGYTPEAQDYEIRTRDWWQWREANIPGGE